MSSSRIVWVHANIILASTNNLTIFNDGSPSKSQEKDPSLFSLWKKGNRQCHLLGNFQEDCHKKSWAFIVSTEGSAHKT